MTWPTFFTICQLLNSRNVLLYTLINAITIDVEEQRPFPFHSTGFHPNRLGQYGNKECKSLWFFGTGMVCLGDSLRVGRIPWTFYLCLAILPAPCEYCLLLRGPMVVSRSFRLGDNFAKNASPAPTTTRSCMKRRTAYLVKSGNVYPRSMQNPWNLFTVVVYPAAVLSASGPFSMALMMSTDATSYSNFFLL
jgi:hypothetical protein